jgi:hypothetical protein
MQAQEIFPRQGSRTESHAVVRGFLATLAVLAIGQGLTFAQEYDLPSGGNRDVRVETFGFWGSGEYLLWWFKNGTVPPLVTAGGDGKLDSPGTQVLVDSLNFDDAVRQGGRFALGYRFKTIPCLGVEANGFFLSDRRSDASFSSGGDPLLAQPFFNVATGQADASLIAKPGLSSGSATISSWTDLWGTEANLTTSLIGSDRFHLTVLAGFRYLRLEDEVTSVERFLVSPTVPGFGGNRVVLEDEFRTVNNFYGGQVGLETGVRFGMVAIDFRGKFALGQIQQVADVAGVATRLSPNGVTTILPPGGLYALRSNSGRHQQDELAFVPEVGLNVGLQMTRRLKLFTGYSFLWISTVARAGEQIDPVINTTQYPIRSGNSPLVGPARPAFPFNQSDFWAQGVRFGLELSF